MTTITSKEKQIFNDPKLGQSCTPVIARVKSFSVDLDRVIAFDGKEHTGVVSIATEFYYSIKDDKTLIEQGVPPVFHFPISIIDKWRSEVVIGEVISQEFPNREIEEFTLILRNIITSVLTVPLFGLGKTTDWIYKK